MATLTTPKPDPSFKLSPTKKALLEAARKQRAALNEGPPAIGRRAPGGAIPLSFGQQRLWFMQHLEGGSAAYNIVFAYRLQGDCHAGALARSLNAIIARHDVLRTYFSAEMGVPRQVIAAQLELPLERVDLTHLPPDVALQTARDRVVDIARTPFDISRLPLMRAVWLQTAADESVLGLCFHHIIEDEWSMDIFLSELAAFYGRETGGEFDPPEPLPIQYADYAAWQADWLDSQQAREQLAYWKTHLDGAPPVLDIPADFIRPAASSFRGGSAYGGLEGADLQRLRGLAVAEHVTLFTALLTAFAAALTRYTETSQVVVGTPITTRRQVELQPLIGFFLNNLPLHLNFSEQPSYRQALRLVNRAVLDGFDHQELPFERLVEAINPPRDLGRHPIFQAAFVLHPATLEQMRLPGLQVTQLPLEVGVARFDLTLFVTEFAGRLDFRLEYAAELFAPRQAGQMLSNLLALLRAALQAPDAPLEQLSLLSPAERARALQGWNPGDDDYPRQASVAELFTRQVEQSPHAPALVFGAQRWNYADLHAQAAAVAAYLHQHGVQPGEPVGLAMPRSAEMVIAMLGVLMAGAAYLPLDPTHPVERLRFMLEDAQARWLICAPDEVERLAAPGILTLRLDQIALAHPEETPGAETPRRAGGPPPGRAKRIAAGQMAYLMYTSGSTGWPKGVCIPHRAVVRLVKNTDYCQVQPGERVAQASNMSFDAATFEVWGALLNGGCLVGVPQATALDSHALADFLRREKIDHLFITTALFNQIAAIAPQAFQPLKTLMFGGEAVTPGLVRQVLTAGGPGRLLHVYGPTETTTFATWDLVESVAPQAVTIPIGRPIAHSSAYVLDANRRPVGIGVPGELYLGGDGLALGYWRRPELTAERFVEAALMDAAAPLRLYRTGDRVRQLIDGRVEFLGRMDQQIKLRGFRIELSEIEAALLDDARLHEAAVILRDDPGVGKRLAAYVSLKPEAAGKVGVVSDLRRRLALRLPEYMLPGAWALLPGLPVNPNGKVDRQALLNLPVSVFEHSPGEGLEKDEAPGDDLEASLQTLWEKLLGRRQVGLDENFFELGGHSLLAVRLFAEVQAELGVRLPLATLFAAPTVRTLAEAMRLAQAGANQGDWSALVPIQPDGGLPPFYCVHNFGGEALDLAPLAQALGPNQPFYGLQALGLDGQAEPHRTIPQMAQYYVQALRAHQAHGPYYLGGFCFGGVVAYEMAVQLRRAGEAVGVLAIIDGSAPGYAQIDTPLSLEQAAAFFANLPYWLSDFFDLGWGEMRVVVMRRIKRAVLGLRRALGLKGQLTMLEIIGEHVHVMEAPDHRRRLMEAHMQAIRDYRPPAYDGRATVFRVRRQPLFTRTRPDNGWGLAARQVSVEITPGAHHNLMQAPYVEGLAQRLAAHLAKARQREVGKQD